MCSKLCIHENYEYSKEKECHSNRQTVLSLNRRRQRFNHISEHKISKSSVFFVNGSAASNRWIIWRSTSSIQMPVLRTWSTSPSPAGIQAYTLAMNGSGLCRYRRKKKCNFVYMLKQTSYSYTHLSPSCIIVPMISFSAPTWLLESVLLRFKLHYYMHEHIYPFLTILKQNFAKLLKDIMGNW